MSEMERVCGNCYFVANCEAFQRINDGLDKIGYPLLDNDGKVGGIHIWDLAKICPYFTPKTKKEKPELLDLNGKNIYIQISSDGKKVWVNTDGRCLLRAQDIPILLVNDKRDFLTEAIEKKKNVKKAKKKKGGKDE